MSVSPARARGSRRTPFLLRVLGQFTPLVEDEMLGLHRVVRPGDVCVDVGANYGLYTHELSRLAGPEGRIHSIEPLPEAYRVLTRLVALRSLANVETHRIALGERAESSVLSVPWRHGLPVHGRAYLTAGARGRGANSEFRLSREVPVEVASLDGLRARGRLDRVDFVKADVEGAELAILRGAERLLAECSPTLLLEIEDRHTRRYGHRASDVLDFLKARGYRIRRWADGAWEPCTGWSDANRNYLFVHPRRDPRS